MQTVQAACIPYPDQAVKTGEYAGLLRRGGGFLLDCGVIMGSGFLLMHALGLLMHSLGVSEERMYELLHPVGFVIGFFHRWFYSSFMEASPWQATVGKRLVGTKVCTEQGARLNWIQATIRHFSKELCVASFLVGFLPIAFTQKRQGAHDKIARTVVRFGKA